VDGVPEVKFARANGSSIAYQVFGDGPVTICAVPPMAQNIELAWESPYIRHMLDGFASFSRYLHFDKRGTGMSDRSLDIPGLDERVDELSAVLDAEGIDRTYLFGASEGGPMALMFAATYPERVDGVILHGSAASLVSDEARDRHASEGPTTESEGAFVAFADAWGTPDSITVDFFAPSLAGDLEFKEWHQRYERQAANRDAIMTLLRLNALMDVRGVLNRIDAPILMMHRVGDPIVSIEFARATYDQLDEAGADVRFVEEAGADHFSYAGDVDATLAEIERFTTGTVRDRPARQLHRARITTMGHFLVEVDGVPVATSDWGSKRARTLLKRLIVARGWPVTRDELFEVLWPGEDSDRLGARLSVQLSAVRRILGGGVIADRSSIRLDLDAVDVDLERWFANDGDDAIVDGYPGEFLPDDRYDDWSGPLRDEMRARFVSAARRVAATAEPARSVGLLRRVLVEDPFDEPSHRALVRTLHTDGRLGEAATAHAVYVAAMDELGVPAADWDSITSA
jgi:pimeloyl-ACP methyl ester carboxylesterase/DNA-binding SARP family transcriptional activator